VSTPGPFGGSNPLDKILRDLLNVLSAGPVNWDVARQVAQAVAAQAGDVSVDPLLRIRAEELLRVAELHVADATGLSLSATGRSLALHSVVPREWAELALAAWQPLLEKLADGLLSSLPADDDADSLGEAEPIPGLGLPVGTDANLLHNLPQMMMSALFGMQAGTMAGQQAVTALGQYDLPIPRPASDEILIVPPTIAGFAADWSLPVDDTMLWVLLRELTTHAVLARPHVRKRLNDLLSEYAGAFRVDVSQLEDRMGSLEPFDLAGMQAAMEDPGALLASMQSPAQDALRPAIDALVAAIAGYVDHQMDRVGRRLIGSYGPLTEALRRRRLEVGGDDQYVGRLFGLELGREQYERGNAFVTGVLERAGEDGLGRLWQSARELPTPAEINAPGLWLARIDLPPEQDGSDRDDTG
jgi:putative hydrolase